LTGAARFNDQRRRAQLKESSGMQDTLLFFDDHYLSSRDNVIRGVGRPALVPESVWRDDERLNLGWGYPSVFLDEKAGLWRMAYQAVVAQGVRGKPFVKLVAESRDGFQWKPRDTTRLVKIPHRRFAHQAADGVGEWSGLYVDEQAPADERYRRLAQKAVWASPDGLRWNHISDWRTDVVDMSAFPFYNAAFKRTFIIGRPSKGDRRMCVFQTDDWRSFTGPILAIQSDGEDEILTDTYGMPVFPYEGWYVGFLWLYRGAAQREGWGAYKYSGGKVDCQLSYSRNGVAWQRTKRDPFIPNGGPGSPDAACVYPCCMVTRPGSTDVWIYACASAWEHGFTPGGAGSILAYRLRKDGFVYLESRSGPGYIRTKPMYWRGGELRLNVHGQGGRAVVLPDGAYLVNGARVQITNSQGQPLKGYTFAECRPFAGDSLAWKPAWKSGCTMDRLKRKDIQVAIELYNARLYAIRGNFQIMSPQDLRDLTDNGQAPAQKPGF
jgi:hypothetical protein